MKTLLTIILLSALVLFTGCASTSELPSDELTLPQTHLTPKNLANTLLNRLSMKAKPVLRDLTALLVIFEEHPELYQDTDLKKKWGVADATTLGDIYEFIETLDVKFAGE